jgi:hypothetical protein
MPATEQLMTLVNSLNKAPTVELRQRIEEIARHLINNDFAGLVEFLYRIDIDEKKLKQLLRSQGDKDSAAIIADLVIQRQLQKLSSKKEFSGKGRPLEDDSW